MFRRARVWMKKFLMCLEEANAKQFGDKKLDCCELNRPDKDISTKGMTENKS